MRRLQRSWRWALLAVLVGASVAEALTATLKVRARLRTAPSVAGEIVDWVPAGTAVEVLAERGGWREVETPQGRGYIWGAHFSEPAAEPAPEASARREERPPTLSEEVRALREEVRSLAARLEPLATVDLEKLRADLERMMADRDAAQGDDRLALPVAPIDPPADAALLLSPVLLALGGAVGWTASRLVQRRRDRRQRNRLRF